MDEITHKPRWKTILQSIKKLEAETAGREKDLAVVGGHKNVAKDLRRGYKRPGENAQRYGGAGGENDQSAGGSGGRSVVTKINSRGEATSVGKSQIEDRKKEKMG